MLKVLAVFGAVLLFLIVLTGLAITVVPRFLDRVYYRGPASDHFDGERFFNPGPGADDTTRPPFRGSRARFFWNQMTGRDGRPAWPERVEAAQARPAARVEGDRMVATWIGHATVLVQTQGLNILTDPVWSERTGPFGRGPRRATAPGVAWDDLPPIDLVLVSHNHWDHLDRPTLARLVARDRPRIVTPLGNDAVIDLPGVETIDWGGRVAIRPGVEVVAVPAHHWGSRWFTDRNRALWSGFVVRLPRGGNLFFAGDTGFGDGGWADAAAAQGPIRLALLPIGAFRFQPGQMESASHMGPLDAVEAFRRTGAARAVAVHWGTFRLSFEGRDTPPRMLALAMRESGQTGFDAVPVGVAEEVPPYAPPPRVAPVARAELLRRMAAAGVDQLR
jgi:L-ascorbate metabolism protein UlaG (beta-lactamase superfamily)